MEKFVDDSLGIIQPSSLGQNMTDTNRPLRVFLCHSSNDKPLVRELYQKLRAENWIRAWLDEEELYPGEDWNMEIEKAVETADAIIVCLTNNSITKEGYIQRELRIVLDYADYKPEGTLYIIPVRLENCEPPRRLRPWQYADYFPETQRERAFQRLLVSLKKRADLLGLKYETSTLSRRAEPVEAEVEASAPKKESKPVVKKPKPAHVSQIANPTYANKLTLSNGMDFMCVPAGTFLMGSAKANKLAYGDERPQHAVDIPYGYWMARFPITNEQYNLYAKAKRIKHPVDDWEKKKDHPVVYVNWDDVSAYSQWLNNLLKNELPSGLVLRLPTEAEWEKAARGKKGNEYPWGNEFDKNKCNSSAGGKGGTTSVGFYSPRGDSPYGCADMVGNVWEWTHSSLKEYPYKANDGREDESAKIARVLRGGTYDYGVRYLRCAVRYWYPPDYRNLDFGFRVAAAPHLS